ncbi:YitT family protein [Staphylococcus capitis subsp. urealyticus]|uniref:YitT family protein n=1 Tax=Staphylococcus capitis TaxID=29388 RepID=UPI00345BE84C
MEKKRRQEHFKNVIFCLLGTLIIALGVNCFVIPGNLGEGGAIGLSLILNYTLGISPALSSFIINAILIVVGWKFLSRTTAIYTAITITASSIFLDLTEHFGLGIHENFINSVFAGLLIGIGTGLVIAAQSTLGGTSVIARIISKYSEVKTSQALLILDALVVLSFLLVLPVSNVLYTIVMLFIVEKAMAFVVEGFNPKKAVTVISEYNRQISSDIYQATGRGSTLLSGEGAYQQNNTDVLYAVVSQSQIGTVKKIVNSYDESAFLVIHDVRDVLGNGFINTK